MRLFSTALLALPALATAQEQKGMFDKAKDWFEDVSGTVMRTVNAPADAAVAKIAEDNTYALTWHNWRNVIKHSGKTNKYDPPEAFMVAVTGGNRTCFGHCERFDKAWNESVVLFKTDEQAPKLARLDCEREELLCGAWGARTGTVLLFLRPQPYQADAPSPLTVHYQNLTTVTAKDITTIHTRKLYMYVDKYEGMLHPFDGWVHKTGAIVPMAWALYALGKIPSSVMLIVVSLFSRTFLNRKIGAAQEQRQQRAAAGGTGGAGAAAAAGAKKNS